MGVSSLAADTKLLICARTSGCTTSSLPVEGSMFEFCGIGLKPRQWPISEPSKTGRGGVDFGRQGLVLERVNGKLLGDAPRQTRRVELLRHLPPPPCPPLIAGPPLTLKSCTERMAESPRIAAGVSAIGYPDIGIERHHTEDVCPSTSLLSLYLIFHPIKMAFSASRARHIQRVLPQLRQYSSSSTPVKRLGVVGAGQMVSELRTCDSLDEFPN